MNLFPRQPDPLAAKASVGPQLLEDLREHYRTLRVLVNLALACVLALGLVVDLFIYKQMRLVRIRVDETRPLVQRMAVEFNRKEPAMRNFVSALQSYAFTHPEFYSVLSKYSNALPQYFVSPARAPLTSPGGSWPPASMPARATPPSTRPAEK